MTSINDMFSNISLNPFAKKAAPKTPAQNTPASPKLDVDKLVLSKPTTHNKVTLHVNPTDADQALLDLIKNAKKSVHIETFIWHNDEAGREVAKALGDRIALAKKNGEPFDAKVMIDSTGLGAGSGGADDKGIVELLKSYGADVKVFNPNYVSVQSMGVPLTHRKLYIADGEEFITGGRNIGNEYLKENYKNSSGGTEPSWHDLLYSVKGDETARIETQFYENWARAGGQVPKEAPVPVPATDGNAAIQSVVTDPQSGEYQIKDFHFEAIRNAKSEIDIMYPYFSDNGLVDELIKAKQANPNLTVKVLLPAGKEASHEGSIYSSLNQETASKLMKAGVKIRMYEGEKVDGQTVQRFSHFKGMLIDNKVLSLGSANGDARTYNSNHELNTLISDDDTIKDFHKEVLDPDWNAAIPLTMADVQNVPFKEKVKRSVLDFIDPLL